MLKQFGGFFGVGDARSAADSGLAQRGENSGVGASIGKLGTIFVRGTECQAARLDFMDDVFVECVTSDQCKQFTGGERFALLLCACERCTTADCEKDNEMPPNRGSHGFLLGKRNSSLEATLSQQWGGLGTGSGMST